MKSPRELYRMLLSYLVASLILAITYSAQAQAIFSFEDGIDPWNSGTTGVTLTQSSFGATDGSSALLLDDVTSGHKGTAARTSNFGPATPGMSDAFEAFALAGSVIANGGQPKLEFDLSWDFANYLPAENNYIQLGIYVNSSALGETPEPGDYHDLGTGAFIGGNLEFNTWPFLYATAMNDGVTLTPIGLNSVHVAIPFAADNEMSISSPSTFYDLGFQSNGGFGGSVDFAIDNILFTGVPVFEEHTLFSWETPDNPATPGVNEQLEGWMPNPTVSPQTQALSITSTGATDGNSALQLDRTLLEDGFTWGSAFALNSDTDPDPNVETIDPVIQGQIDDFVTRINGATQIAIDITYEDQFPISPTYSQLFLAFSDETGAYYQAGSSSFDINNAVPGTMETLIFDLAAFDDFNSDKNLAVDGLEGGTNAFGIVLGTGTDDGAVYQIDNFRLISEVTSDSGDFDGDGDVDGNDFLVWQRGGSPNGINSGDLALWQSQYDGTPPLAASTAVPEPSALLLTFSTIAMFITCGRRK